MPGPQNSRAALVSKDKYGIWRRLIIVTFADVGAANLEVDSACRVSLAAVRNGAGRRANQWSFKAEEARKQFMRCARPGKPTSQFAKLARINWSKTIRSDRAKLQRRHENQKRVQKSACITRRGAK